MTGQSRPGFTPPPRLRTQQWRVRLEDELSACSVFPARISLPRLPLPPARPGSTWTRAPGSSGATSGPPADTPGSATSRNDHEFNRIVQELEVHRAGELIYRDRYTWEGPWDAAASQWYLGGSLSDATGSLFITGKVDLPPPGVAARSAARAPLAHGDTLIRWCGSVAEVTAEWSGPRWASPPTGPAGTNAPEWLIGSNHLVPNHWFSVELGQPASPEGDADPEPDLSRGRV